MIYMKRRSIDRYKDVISVFVLDKNFNAIKRYVDITIYPNKRQMPTNIKIPKVTLHTGHIINENGELNSYFKEFIEQFPFDIIEVSSYREGKTEQIPLGVIESEGIDEDNIPVILYRRYDWETKRMKLKETVVWTISKDKDEAKVKYNEYIKPYLMNNGYQILEKKCVFRKDDIKDTLCKWIHQ